MLQQVHSHDPWPISWLTGKILNPHMKGPYRHTSGKFRIVALDFFWMYRLIKEVRRRKFIIQMHPDRIMFYIHFFLVLDLATTTITLIP
jgi:hypothetical protein